MRFSDPSLLSGAVPKRCTVVGFASDHARSIASRLGGCRPGSPTAGPGSTTRLHGHASLDRTSQDRPAALSGVAPPNRGRPKPDMVTGSTRGLQLLARDDAHGKFRARHHDARQVHHPRQSGPPGVSLTMTLTRDRQLSSLLPANPLYDDSQRLRWPSAPVSQRQLRSAKTGSTETRRSKIGPRYQIVRLCILTVFRAPIVPDASLTSKATPGRAPRAAWLKHVATKVTASWGPSMFGDEFLTTWCGGLASQIKGRSPDIYKRPNAPFGRVAIRLKVRAPTQVTSPLKEPVSAEDRNASRDLGSWDAHSLRNRL
eukprot:gene10321-8254_t